MMRATFGKQTMLVGGCHKLIDPSERVGALLDISRADDGIHHARRGDNVGLLRACNGGHDNGPGGCRDDVGAFGLGQ